MEKTNIANMAGVLKAKLNNSTIQSVFILDFTLKQKFQFINYS